MSKEVNGKLFGKGLLGPIQPNGLSRLHELYTQPPFSFWDTKDGRWQDRKRAWLRLGIASDEGRGGELTYHIPTEMSDGRAAPMDGVNYRNTSVFDPVVCELCYSWWCPPGGVVVDPFCGGSVRGIVATVLGRRYWGVDLRPEQVAANQAQWRPEFGKPRPRWVVGDCQQALRDAPAADFLFTCPPYGDLERYSDDPADLSTMVYEAFAQAYYNAIRRAVRCLRDDRFAVFVVGNYRDKQLGIMNDLVGDTIRSFESAGCGLYNDIVLLNPVGSGAMRANTSFLRGARKVVKLHQNVLVFVKGDPRKAARIAAG